MQSAAVPTLITLLKRGVPRAKGVEADRNPILDAAEAAFLEFGIRRTSMAEIARRSGVSPASLYRWFGSKDDLVVAVVVRDAQRFAAELEATIDRSLSAEDQLAETTVRVARRLRSTPFFERMVQTEPESILPQLTVLGAPLIEAGTESLAKRLRRLQDEGRLGRFDPVSVAEIVIRVAHSLLLTRATSLPLDDDDQLFAAAGAAIRLLLHAPDSNGPHDSGSV
jgi:AcrR family transcriptional regulator